jgi:hypothetical protein
MKAGTFCKLIFLICVVGLFGVLASYSHGRDVSREWGGRAVAANEIPTQRKATPVELVGHELHAKEKKRYEYPFACEDTDKPCLTLLAAKDNPRPWKNNKVSDVDNVFMHRKGPLIAGANH